MVELKQSIHLTINGQDIELTTADARELYALLGAAIGNAPAPTPVHAPLKTPYPGWFEFPLNPTCHTGYHVEPTVMVSSYGYKPKSDTLSALVPGQKPSTLLGDPPAGFFWDTTSGETQLKPWLPMEYPDGTLDIPATPIGWKRINQGDHMSPLVRI